MTTPKLKPYRVTFAVNLRTHVDVQATDEDDAWEKANDEFPGPRDTDWTDYHDEIERVEEVAKEEEA